MRNPNEELPMDSTAKTFPKVELDKIGDTFPGRFGFMFKDLNTGMECKYNADTPMPTASVCKVAVMVELFRQDSEGILSLDDRHPLRKNISSHGTGTLSITRDYPTLTVRDYCRLMMGVSDNMATDMCIGLVGPDHIAATMERMGYHNTRTPMPLGVWHYLMKGVVEEPSRELDAQILTEEVNGPGDKTLPYASSLDNNVASARNLCDIMEEIEKREMVSPEASEFMIKMMKVPVNPNRIRQYLKPEIITARKTGGSNRIKADTGIVYLPTGPLVMAGLATADDREDAQRGMDAIADAARLVYETLSPESVLTA